MPIKPRLLPLPIPISGVISRARVFCGTKCKLKMNFDVDYRHIRIVRSPQAVPLLVLVREWGRHKQDAFLHADAILLILRGIQPLANFEYGMVSVYDFDDHYHILNIYIMHFRK